jgi:hypothetical protein
VNLGGFVGVMPGVKSVPSCGMRVMGCFFVVSPFVLLGCFGMVAGGVGMVLS